MGDNGLFFSSFLTLKENFFLLKGKRNIIYLAELTYGLIIVE